MDLPPLLEIGIFPEGDFAGVHGAVVSEIASIVLIQNPDHRGVRILLARDWKGT